MRNKPWFAVVYMFVVTAFFSSILIGFSRMTREQVEANQQLQFEKAVLNVLPVDLPEDPTNLELHRAFVDRVNEPTEETGGAYTSEKNGNITGYALPVEGQGFWAPIKGVVGFRSDKKTIRGIDFYEQNETPGLGGEIVKPDFRNRFEGLIIDLTGKPLIISRGAGETAENEVHAITGATQTCSRLEKFVNNDIQNWLKKMQGGD